MRGKDERMEAHEESEGKRNRRCEEGRNEHEMTRKDREEATQRRRGRRRRKKKK